MIRINLLPREITEKRKFEHAIVYVFIVGGALLAVVVAVWLLMLVQTNGQRDELQTLEQRSAKALQTAEDYRIFEERETVLQQRFIIAQEALAQRVDWGRLMNELSLVLPPDTFLEFLSGGEVEGLRISGKAIDSPLDIPDWGFKTVAKTLVRLTQLEQLEDVWAVDATRGVDEESLVPYVNFSITAGVVLPEAPVVSVDSAAPAPPASPSGQ